MALSGFPVSGLDVIEMPWRAVPTSGAIWLHGGDYGPEGGVVATVVLVLGIGWLLLKKQEAKPGGKSGPAAGAADADDVT